MLKKLDNGKFAVVCDCCGTVYDSSQKCNTEAIDKYRSESIALDLLFMCNDPLHICEECLFKIRQGSVKVNFARVPIMSPDDVRKIVSGLHEEARNVLEYSNATEKRANLMESAISIYDSGVKEDDENARRIAIRMLKEHLDIVMEDDVNLAGKEEK